MTDNKTDITIHGATDDFISVPLARYEELVDRETRTEVLVEIVKGKEYSAIAIKDVLKVLGITL